MENKTEKEVIQEFYRLIKTKDNHQIEELLNWTIWTFYKWYDDEEEEEAIIEDTINWIRWEANYMKS